MAFFASIPIKRDPKLRAASTLTLAFLTVKGNFHNFEATGIIELLTSARIIPSPFLIPASIWHALARST